MAAPPPADFEWGPVLTGIGIAVSLIWNGINTWLSRHTKKRDARYDEFKRLRARLDTALDDLRSTIASLKTQSVRASKKATLRTELERLNKELAATDQKTRAILRDLERSPYVHEKEWVSGITSHWDNALTALNGAYEANRTLVDQKAAVASCVGHLEGMIAALDATVASEVSRYASKTKP